LHGGLIRRRQRHCPQNRRSKWNQSNGSEFLTVTFERTQGASRLNRRRFLAAAATLPLLKVSALRATTPAEPIRFGASTVRDLARETASKPFVGPDDKLPQHLRDLTYDRYRALRFKPDFSLWRKEKLPFEVQFFHRGFLYAEKVQIFEVVDGRATPLAYMPDWFEFGDIPPPETTAQFGFAGFRIHAPMNRPDYYDEVCAFLGASYFRAVAKGQTYGLSARGLALNTGEASGEEFPAFRAFFLEKPKAKAASLVVHALLDSKSTAAAFRFTIRPGETTVFDTEMAIYPRNELKTAGLAPMTSMFMFGPNDRTEVDDFRPAVHDSDGLAIQNGRGEQLWRPICNPRDLQISQFGDLNPRGFGLLQREKNFAAYQDIESRFETRPSIWVEPVGDWGEGDVRLIEIPTREEVHDNIACFWRPKEPLKAEAEHTFTYRINWGAGLQKPPPLATFSRTAIGTKGDKTKLFVLDLVGERLKGIDAKAVRGVVTAGETKVENIVTQPNPLTGGWRLSFEVAASSKPVELRATVLQGEDPVSEVWVYRWTP
jgi:periplasmic glucans biosynthesis protein